MRSRPMLFVGLLWALEWIFGWSTYLGAAGQAISIIWLIGLGYLVIESRTGRLHRTLHTWIWMTAVLVIAMIRAAWWGRDSGWFSELARLVHIPEHPLGRAHADEVRSTLAAGMTGVAIGLAGAIESVIIGIMSWIGDALWPADERPRVSFVARVAVVVLQAPIFVVVMLYGLALVGGGVAHAAVIPFGAGLLLWALAVMHLDRLLAVARGHWTTRAALVL